MLNWHWTCILNLFMKRRSHISVQFVITFALKREDWKSIFDLVHENNKSYKCSICDHNFTKNLPLDMHIESVHEKVIYYNSTICSFKFSVKLAFFLVLILILFSVKSWWNMPEPKTLYINYCTKHVLVLSSKLQRQS